MSTKNSLAFGEYIEKKSLHIYQELMDGKYYIEDSNAKVELPEDIAKKFAKILNETKEMKWWKNKI